MNRIPPTSTSGVVLLLVLLSSSLAGSQEAGSRGAAPSPPSLAVQIAESPGYVLASVRGRGMALTAELAAEIATKAAPSVDYAIALLAEARAGAERARYGFMPQLDVVASYTRLPTSKDTLVPNSVSRDIDAVADPAARDLWEQHALVLKNRYAVTSTVTFPVSDYFFELWPRYQSSKGFEKARAIRVEAERSRVALSAREAYYAFARARAAAAVQRRAIDHAERTAQLIETKAKQGQVHRADTLRVRAELAGARATLVRSEGGVEISGTALRSMLQLEPGTPIALEEDLLAALPTSVESVETLTRRAIDARAEARALRAAIIARGLAVDAAEGSRLPNLLVQGHVELGSPNSRIFLEERDPRTTGYISVVLVWSLEELLMGGPAADEQRAAQRQGRADLRGLEIAIRSQVAEARAAYQAALLTRAAAELSHKAAEESHRLQVAEFERGRALTADVLEAVAALARAEMELLNAAIDGRIALAHLERAVGIDGLASKDRP